MTGTSSTGWSPLHPDDDHSRGLTYVVDNLKGGALWMHQPGNHAEDIASMFKSGRATDMGVRDTIRRSLDAAMSLDQAVRKRGVDDHRAVHRHVDGLVHVIGPTVLYDKSLMPDFRCTPEATEPLPSSNGSAESQRSAKPT